MSLVQVAWAVLGLIVVVGALLAHRSRRAYRVALWALAPRVLKMFGLAIFSLRDRPWTAFVAFLAVSVATYLPAGTFALGALTGCADIHPAPDDPVDGMLEAPTDEADQFRRAEERSEEDHEEGGERRR